MYINVSQYRKTNLISNIKKNIAKRYQKSFGNNNQHGLFKSPKRGEYTFN